jgi:hypothetical protein
MGKHNKHQAEPTALCPFKKAVSVEYNSNTGRKEIHERFEECAGERCMAFKRRGITISDGYCMRVEGEYGNG